MKKIIIILLISVIIILGISGIYFGFFNKEKVPVIIDSGDKDVELMPSEKIEISIGETINNNILMEVDVKQPTFQNLSDYAFQENINRKIASAINPYLEEINIVADESTPSTTKYRYFVSFNRYNTDQYVSLVVSQNYSTGGLRSNNWKDTYTVDVLKNKEVLLKDICDFKNYKEEIVKEINAQGKEKEIELIAGNGLANIPDTQKFYIKDKELYIYFEPASIAPYLDGEMHFKMPFKYEEGKFVK